MNQADDESVEETQAPMSKHHGREACIFLSDIELQINAGRKKPGMPAA
jgi:hypothetical protein